MVCPYCSTDMTPIELNGKVFCSNCGLTIAAPPAGEPTTVASEPVNQTASIPETVSNVETQEPEEVEFPVIPEVVEAVEPETTNVPTPVTPTETDGVSAAVDYFGQFGDTDAEPEGVKLPVQTEEPIPEPSRPITEEAARDLGITLEVAPEIAPEPTVEPTVLESKIADINIPSEEDFDNNPGPAEQSYVEIANPGDEKGTLEASGILLDILGNDGNTKEITQNTKTVSTPVVIPTVAEESLSDIPEEKDDIYTLPSEVKVGLRNKKIHKKQSAINDQPEAGGTRPEPNVDTKIEKKIEKLEEKIAETPEPAVELTTEEATQYDPDTIEKSKIIKDYFSTAIEKDKKAIKTKAIKKKNKKSLKTFGLVILGIVLAGALGVGGYMVYASMKPATVTQESAETATFTTLSPSYIPEGYTLITSNYTDADKTFQMNYQFGTLTTKTIVFKQAKVADSKTYISDYITSASATFTEKVVDGITFTEVNSSNLLWTDGDFVFVIETKNFTFANDLLYKMAETVGK